MKTIIAGGRNITDFLVVCKAIMECPWVTEITEVVSGKAIGVDTLGEEWADLAKIPVKPFPVTKEQYRVLGRYLAPKARNTQMADYAEALILIWDGESGGSSDMKKKALDRGLKFWERIVLP